MPVLGIWEEVYSLEDYRRMNAYSWEDFFRKIIPERKLTVSYTAMERALRSSRFAGLCWEDILKEYFGEELCVRKEQKIAEQEQRMQYFSGVIQEADYCQNSPNPGCLWLEQTLRTKGEGYLLLIKQYKEEPEQLKRLLLQFLKAVPNLPFLNTVPENVFRKKELLAVFAAENTGDPHFFDIGTIGEQLLTAFLRASLIGPDPVSSQPAKFRDSDSIDLYPDQKESGLTDPQLRETGLANSDRREIDRTMFPAEKKAELFYRAGLLKDDLSNHTLVYGIHAWKENGELHEGIEGFLRCKEPVQLTLMTLSGLKRVCGQKENTVYIVENPAVFSSLVKTWPEASVICGNGQIRLATLVLMDLFDGAATFYYAGDFDPEGLQIAQRLKERYGNRLQLWNYRREYYETYRSQVEISQKSLKKLDKIYLEELKEIKSALMEYKSAAYQETMLREYLVHNGN